MKAILAVSAVLLASCASAPTSSQDSSNVTVLASPSVSPSEVDAFRKVALNTVGDIGSLSVDIYVKAPRDYRESYGMSTGTFTPPSLAGFGMGGDGAIWNSIPTNVAVPSMASPGLGVHYVIRDASGNVLAEEFESISFTAITGDIRGYQKVVDRIAKRVKQLSGKT